MTQTNDDAVSRAARLLAGALNELQRAGADATISRAELERSHEAIETLTRRMEQHLAEDAEQRAVLAGQLTALTGSLERLVDHLEGLSKLIADVMQRGEPPQAAAPGASGAPEPVFRPGGEGLSLQIGGVPGFQALMEIQKALQAMQQVASASVERFQEGDCRIEVQLSSEMTAAELVAALAQHTGSAIVVEEARPELSRLHVKVIGDR